VGRKLQHAALLDARGVVAALGVQRHRRLDLLVQADLHEVDMDEVTTDRMQLHVLEDHRARVAVDLEVDQRARSHQHAAQLARIDGEADVAPVRTPVDDAGDLAALAEAAGHTGAELLAHAYIDCRSVGGHRNGPV
jgi:hypothetical protein